MNKKEKIEVVRRVEQRWPLMRNLMLRYFNEDYDLLYGSLQGALNNALGYCSLEHGRAVLKEWRDWDNSDDAKGDIRPFLYNGLSIAVFFNQPEEARQFMNGIYDRLLEQVKAGTRHHG
jgi:hypothetical protein